MDSPSNSRDSDFQPTWDEIDNTEEEFYKENEIDINNLESNANVEADNDALPPPPTINQSKKDWS